MSLSGVWNRYGCCPKNEKNDVIPEPNALIVELLGYNYRAIPNFFDNDGVRLIPIVFENDHKYGFYKWKFYKDPRNPMAEILMTTSDDIMPNVVINSQKMDIHRYTKHNGYTTWVIPMIIDKEKV